MAYRVVTQRRAEVDIALAYAYILEQGAPEAALRWYRGVKAEIQSLAEMPHRFTTAPESEALGIDLRQVHYGKRTGAYRIIFRIVEAEQEVHVLTIRHGAREPLDLSDLR